jgi:hypothetical protein
MTQETVLELLQGIQIIKEGCAGNNVMTVAQTNTLFGVVASQAQHNTSSSSLREKSALRPSPTYFKSNSVSRLTLHQERCHANRRSTCVQKCVWSGTRLLDNMSVLSQL